MSEFKMLENGHIIAVLRIDGGKQIVEGRSFKDFDLKQRTFSFNFIKEDWEMDIHEVRVAFKKIDRTKYPKHYTEEDKNLVTIRVRDVETLMRQVEYRKNKTLEFNHRH